jgi:hypothetical protein
MKKNEEKNMIRVMTSSELMALKVKKDKSIIPDNPSYCYKSIRQSKDNPDIFPITELCPYWRIAVDKPKTLDGYCLFLEEGDWQEDGTMALFDQLKNCGINNSYND